MGSRALFCYRLHSVFCSANNYIEEKKTQTAAQQCAKDSTKKKKMLFIKVYLLHTHTPFQQSSIEKKDQHSSNATSFNCNSVVLEENIPILLATCQFVLVGCWEINADPVHGSGFCRNAKGWLEGVLCKESNMSEDSGLYYSSTSLLGFPKISPILYLFCQQKT